MISPNLSIETINSLIQNWRRNLSLTNLENFNLKSELLDLDNQLTRLEKKCIRIAVFGRVGVGKSSLLNALIGEDLLNTDVAHGCTKQEEIVEWNEEIYGLNSIHLIDTPGIDEVSGNIRGETAHKTAIKSDLILLVVDSDINQIELKALQDLLRHGKPIFIVLNRCDQWIKPELNTLLKSIRNRLPKQSRGLIIQAAASAPRKVYINCNGEVRSNPSASKINSLKESLITILSNQGEFLLSLNSLRTADAFHQKLKSDRLQRKKESAQALIGKFAAIKASGLAANPFLMLDFAGGLACDTALVMKLSKLYGLPMKGHDARKLAKKLSFQNAFISGTQIGIQLFLSAFKQLLLISTPLTGGLTLAASAPVAIVQAALAVKTTQKTGKLAAKVFLESGQLQSPEPSQIFKKLLGGIHEANHFLGAWPKRSKFNQIRLLSLLP